MASRRAELRADYLAARGFTSEADAPAGLVAVADGAAQAVLLRDGCFEKLIDVAGPHTTKDRRRAVFGDWKECAGQALAHLKAIGLERIEKDAGTLESYLTPKGEQQR